VDVPASLDSALFNNCSGQACFARFAYTIYLGLQPPSGSLDTTKLQTVGSRNITVVHGAGTQTPAGVVYAGAGPHWDRFVPYPKLVLALSSQSENTIPAADITVAIPPNVTVMDVFEEESGGRNSIVLWRMTGSVLNISLVAPSKNVNRLA